ncbi:MAG: YhcH/YjgK/YiaL family protein [Candidatus Hydrogenedentes bacterium]|nr:YhcH/YjgK/YiaL family protein [Candidatus Hydrogenedentota bacterium]
MIMDLLKNWELYSWPSARFGQGFAHLLSLGADVADGRYELDGDNLFCMVQSYETKPRDEQEFEAHREYADIQILLEGKESILWAPREGLSVSKPYEPDFEFYSLIPGATDLVLRPGQFCVFMPDDAHAPCITHETPCTVRKAVVKVKL